MKSSSVSVHRNEDRKGGTHTQTTFPALKQKAAMLFAGNGCKWIIILTELSQNQKTNIACFLSLVISRFLYTIE